MLDNSMDTSKMQPTNIRRYSVKCSSQKCVLKSDTWQGYEGDYEQCQLVTSSIRSEINRVRLSYLLITNKCQKVIGSDDST